MPLFAKGVMNTTEFTGFVTQQDHTQEEQYFIMFQRVGGFKMLVIKRLKYMEMDFPPQ